MQIERLSFARRDDFYQFNQAIDPTRHDFVERFEFQMLNHPLIADATALPVIIAIDERGQIIGQHLHLPCQYYFGGRLYGGFYGYDFYVLKTLRGRGIGSALARASNQQFYPHFGVGVAKASQKILISLGNRIIGSLFIYLWIRNWLSPVKFAIKQFSGRPRSTPDTQFVHDRFPDEIIIDKFRFKLVTSLPKWHYRYWNDDTLEFSRTLDFMRWRFLTFRDRYCFYLLDEPSSTTYGVFRKITARGLNLLAMVDYRVAGKDLARYASVLKLAKHLAKLGGFDGILTMSSHRFFDEALKRHLFWRVGKPIIILTNASLEFDQAQVNQRSSVLATMADSDLDFYFQF